MTIPLTRMPGALDLRAATLSQIEAALSADSTDAVRAILVTSAQAEAAHALVERCWHDAAVIVADEQASLSHAA